MLIHTPVQRSQKKKKRNTSKKFLAAKSEHQKFLDRMGVSAAARKTIRGSRENFADLTVESRAAAVSNSIPANGYKKSIDDYKWKRDREESAEAIAAAEEKRKRIAPAFNKGPVMYITDDADAASLGRKV